MLPVKKAHSLILCLVSEHRAQCIQPLSQITWPSPFLTTFLGVVESVEEESVFFLHVCECVSNVNSGGWEQTLRGNNIRTIHMYWRLTWMWLLLKWGSCVGRALLLNMPSISSKKIWNVSSQQSNYTQFILNIPCSDSPKWKHERQLHVLLCCALLAQILGYEAWPYTANM